MKIKVLLICFIILIFSCSNSKVIKISSSKELESLFEKPQYFIEVHLASGEYFLNPKSIIDSTCGNCEDPNTPIPATVGLIISGKNIKLIGPEDRSAIIHTNAGYGLFIKKCESCIIENLSITGGIRDTSAFASDAAIVVKNSNATIKNNKIYENLGDSLLISKNIVGIMGICGRENSKIEIIENEIICNSWDGIALYRDSEAIILRNIIDGIDKRGGRKPSGGRGVGIGVTWNAKALIEENLISRYWKGIGIFVDANCTIRNNIVEDLITWGIALWDAGKGKPKAKIENNIIYDVGACGISITHSQESEEPGYLIGNIIVKAAQDSAYDSPDFYCYQCALAKHDVPENFLIEENLFFNNRRATNDLPDYDLSEHEFYEQFENKKMIWNSIPIYKKSKFYKDFFE
ncbi:MAG: right-handed parallel beta-helix repeat-containing protein [Armatimonadetes bacterium]|nr:right-handed parallel beta-helix repeat-containing protein [Armatimonadota bacterium]